MEFIILMQTAQDFLYNFIVIDIYSKQLRLFSGFMARRNWVQLNYK